MHATKLERGPAVLPEVCPGTGNTVQQGNYHARHQTGAWSCRPTRNS